MRVCLIWLALISLMLTAAAAGMEVDTAATNSNASLAFDSNAQQSLTLPPVPEGEGSDPSPVIDDTLDEANRIEVVRRLKAAGHKAFFVKDFVAKLVDYLPKENATIASLCQANGIDEARFYRLQTIPENPTPEQLEELYTFMGELGHT